VFFCSLLTMPRLLRMFTTSYTRRRSTPSFIAEPSTVRVGGLGGVERARKERVRRPRDLEAREYARPLSLPLVARPLF
jgi:hypothetical protein